MNKDTHRDLGAARARFCYDAVARWDERWRSEATKRVQGIPVQIRAQGLMVTLAVLQGEGTNHADQLAGSVARWLLKEAPRPVFGEARLEPAKLLHVCAHATRADYAAAQREAIRLFDQMKIYANALNNSGQRT